MSIGIVKRRRLISPSASFFAAPLVGSAALTETAEFDETQVASPMTITAVALGSAFASRTIVLVLPMFNSYDMPVTSLTIGGVSATLQQWVGQYGGSFSGAIVFAWADVPTGTTGNIVITGGVSAGNGQINGIVYQFNKSLAIDAAPTFSSLAEEDSGTSLAVSMNTGAGGFVIGVIVHAGADASIATSDETYVDSVEWSGKYVVAKLSGSSVHTPSDINFNYTSGNALATMMHWK